MSFGEGAVKLQLTKSKVLKYRSRLSKSFDAYHKTSKFNEQKARKLLIKRIRFLTSNTRLLNNKKNIELKESLIYEFVHQNIDNFGTKI